jgi:predicted secreted protein
MLTRILFSTIAAASLVAATPALAGASGKDAETRETRDAPAQGETRAVPECCEQMALEHRELMQQRKAADEQARRAQEEDPFVRNQSWGG